MSVKIIAISLALLTALFETVGAYGCGIYWSKTNGKLFPILLILMGFGGSIVTYLIMRKLIPDLAVGQAFFIGGTAVFAVLVALISTKTFDLMVAVGIIVIAIGAIIINRALPE